MAQDTSHRRIRYGMVGGGQGAFIGAVHRIAARIDDEYELCAGALSSNPEHRVLVQGELPKRALVEEFADDETSVLVATMGFWEGIDVPGRSLELVILDRLPFPRPDDPLWEARRERATVRRLHHRPATPGKFGFANALHFNRFAERLV